MSILLQETFFFLVYIMLFSILLLHIVRRSRQVSMLIYFSHLSWFIKMSLLSNWKPRVVGHQVICWWLWISDLNVFKLLVLLLLLRIFNWWMIVDKLIFHLLLSVCIKSRLIWCSSWVSLLWLIWLGID